MVDRSRGGAFGFVAEIPSPRHDAGAGCLIESGSGAESTMFSDTEHYGVTAGLYKLDPRLRPGYPPHTHIQQNRLWQSGRRHRAICAAPSPR